MDIKDMKYFLAVIEAGSINAAAKRLHIAQPPLSRQMKQLEENLGIKLFERGNRKVKLTEAGRLMQDRAEQFLGQIENTIREMREFDAGSRGTIAIGTVTSSGATILPRVVRVFRDSFPGVRFQLWEGETNRIIELLNRGAIEIGIARFSIDSELYESIKLPNEPLVAALHINCAAYEKNDKEFIEFSELAGKPLLIHRKYEAMIIEHGEQYGFTPEFVCMSDDVMPILAWADADIGIAIVPRTAIGLIPSANLVYKTITNPYLELTSNVIWLRNRYLSAAAHNFLQLFTTLSSKSLLVDK
ncbi:LysR family transcriptional regulator [Sporomusa acidovorans]|uniref:HTH-type transcriptional regulator BenM n=1 Tax=Sporomusa acidovorans (strain ATCC 49682 / DSM 3132 / Mol) TaxID=1123286 RepID=A0ABZ3J2T2_SPOA4|nr:LysR family transcriptional regulator [Sporomusa acidovorans]OZC21995.1 HTH-type transcriptional regulator BenM [Sporomusa acidovorans DSM 3132]SDF80128.1 transcriptional regulator, LysR family [Sporomusa acidovorans]